MGNKPENRKKQEAYEHFVEDNDGGLFGDDIELDKYVVEDDPISEMRKYTIHFRMMVLLPEFTWLYPGLTLSYGKPGDLQYDEGVIDENGRIFIPARDKTVPTLTAFATEVIPDSWYKTEKSGSKGKSRPDGWNRVWVSYPDGGFERPEDILFKHHKDLNYTVDELARLDSIYSDMRDRGYGEQIADLEADLKTWHTKQKNQKPKGTQKS